MRREADQFGQWKDNRQFFMEFNEPNDTDEVIERENTPMDFAPLLDSLLETKVVYKGETIEELAKSMGVDADTMKASADQYNQAIKDGKDELFFADTNRLVELKEGPYYAIKFVARNLGTLGGVRINEKIQAIDADGQEVPNLYVAGADAGGSAKRS